MRAQTWRPTEMALGTLPSIMLKHSSRGMAAQWSLPFGSAMGLPG